MLGLILTLKTLKMVKAKFTYEVSEFAGRNCIFIVDIGQQDTSVTNDIENVVAEICETENISAKDYMIVYQDSDGMWDGWDHKSKQFVSLQCANRFHAVRRYIKQQLGTGISISNINPTKMATKRKVTQEDLDKDPELASKGAILDEDFEFPDDAEGEEEDDDAEEGE